MSANPNSRQGTREIDPLTAERDFFRARSLHRNSDWCGLSSDAMLDQALTGAERPAEYPRDKWDLERCEETYRRAPAHLQERMLPTLELFRRMIGPSGYVDGLWCRQALLRRRTTP